MNNFKTANAHQAKGTHHYKSIKEKLRKTKGTIKFNKMCSTYHLTPNYIHVNSFNISAFPGVICELFIIAWTWTTVSLVYKVWKDDFIRLFENGQQIVVKAVPKKSFVKLHTKAVNCENSMLSRRSLMYSTIWLK